MNTTPSRTGLVRDFLESSADASPDKVALVFGDQRLTYATIEEHANRIAHGLMHHGVRRGDRVGLFLKNSIEAVVGIFAVLKAGATFVFINHTTKADKLAYILNNCGATALLSDNLAINREADGASLRSVSSLRILLRCGGSPEAAPGEAAANNGPLRFAWSEWLKEFPPPRPARNNIDLDLACLIYTSGSTGDPKGVMSTHANVTFAASSIIEYLGNQASDIVINVLPLSFDYGLYQLLMTFKFGGTLVLETSFAYPAAVLEVIVREKVTGFAGVPTLYAMLVGMDLNSYDLSHLRYLSNTAAALPVSHIEALRRKFPQAQVFSMYGLTETKRTLFLPPAELDRRPGSVGIPIPGTEAWIEDENGRRLGAGEVGELVVRGRHVMAGYWGAPEVTARRYPLDPVTGDRVCRTGDLFRTDAEGFFYFVSRRDDIIKSRGEKVAPKEVENVIYGLPGVRAVAVIGVPDAVLGQAIKAFVVTSDETLTDRKVLAHCRAHLEDFMIPKLVEFCAELPQTSTGKIKKSGLS